MPGTSMTLLWSADRRAVGARRAPPRWHTLGKEADRSGWMMWDVWEVKTVCLSVPMQDLEIITVDMEKMLVSSVKVRAPVYQPYMENVSSSY